MSGALALVAAALLAQRPVPPQPQAPTQTYQPDQQACKPEQLLAGYRQGLGAYADQPPAVLAQLSGLQRQLTARSLKVCLEKRLLKADQVERLMETMGLAVPAEAPKPSTTPELAAPQPAQRTPERPKPAVLQPAAPNPAATRPAAVKPAALKPAAPKSSSGRSSSPKTPSFDMSPLESNPTRLAPGEPKTQDDPGSPR